MSDESVRSRDRPDLSGDRQVVSACDRFEAAWQAGNIPSIRDYLDEVKGVLRLELLRELVLLDLYYRWMPPQPPGGPADDTTISPVARTHGPEDATRPRPHARYRLEEYVRAFPELGPLHELPTHLVAEEYRVRRLAGDEPEKVPYIERFPEHDDLPRQLAEVDQQVDQAVGGPTTHAFAGVTPRARKLELRCPHCHHPVPIESDTRSGSVTCSACQGQIDLVSHHLPTREAAPLTTIAHFTLVERLGLGGFATVWRAYDTKLDRTVAIKIPRRDQLSAEETDKFVGEARAAAQLKHPNIVPVHDVGFVDETLYIVSDFVAGTDLSKWIAESLPTPQEAARMARQIADAMHHAHSLGIVHRDLKPHNILVDQNGTPHVTDFGLAKRESADVMMTLDGQVLGTPAYMSPEQALGQVRTTDRRTDIYSLGVILFEMLTGELPFRGNARMIMHRVIHDEPPGPIALNATIPRDLDTICLKCLQKSPAARYQSARELELELQRFLSGQPIHARPIGTLHRMWRWARRKPTLAASAVVSVVLLVAIVVISVTAAVTVDAERRRAVDLANQKSWIAAQEAAAKAEAERRRAQSDAVFDYLVEAFRSPDAGREGYEVTVVEILDRVLAEVQTRYEDHPELQFKMLHTLGKTYIGLGVGTRAVESLERAVAVARRDWGADDREVVEAQIDFATALELAGEYQRGVLAAESALENARRTLGPETPQVAQATTRLANLYLQTSKPEQALLMCDAAEPIAHSLSWEGEDGPIKVGRIRVEALRQLGQTAEAIATCEELLARQQRLSGSEDPALIKAMSLAASLYHDVGRHQESIELFERVLEFTERHHRPDHPATLHALGNLGTAYHAAGRLDEAFDAWSEALRLKKHEVGDEHPETLSSLHNLAVAYKELGEREKALEMFAEVVELRREILGVEHEATLRAMNNLAVEYADAGRFQDGIELSTQVFEARERLLGVDHVDTHVARFNVGWACERSGRPAAAAGHYQAAEAGFRRLLGPADPRTLRAATRLAAVWIELGKFEEAVRQYVAVADGIEKSPAPAGAVTLALQCQLAEAYSLAGDLYEARQTYDATLEAARETLPPNHPIRVKTQLGLAKLLIQATDAKKGTELAREMVAILDSHPESERLLPSAYRVLGTAHLARDDFAAAEAQFRDCLESAAETSPHWHTAYVRLLLAVALDGQQQRSEAARERNAALATLDPETTRIPPGFAAEVAAAVAAAREAAGYALGRPPTP